MYQEIPPIVEDADTLKQQFTAERHPVKRQRLHMLYLLASRQATTRITVAALLGLSRNTIGRWLTLYTTAGLAGLLQVYRPAGKAPALTADQRAQLQAKLADPAGFATYQDIRTWINTTFGTTMTLNAVHKLVRYKLGAKPKVPRHTNPKKTQQP
jgi:transposase